jgi:hypothetical protein
LARTADCASVCRVLSHELRGRRRVRRAADNRQTNKHTKQIHAAEAARARHERLRGERPLARAGIVSHEVCAGAPACLPRARLLAHSGGTQRGTIATRAAGAPWPLAPAPPRHAPARQVPEDARPQPRRLQGTRRPRGAHAAPTAPLRRLSDHGRCRRTKRAGGSTTFTSSWRSSGSSESSSSAAFSVRGRGFSPLWLASGSGVKARTDVDPTGCWAEPGRSKCTLGWSLELGAVRLKRH